MFSSQVVCKKNITNKLLDNHFNVYSSCEHPNHLLQSDFFWGFVPNSYFFYRILRSLLSLCLLTVRFLNSLPSFLVSFSPTISLSLVYMLMFQLWVLLVINAAFELFTEFCFCIEILNHKRHKLATWIA